ncbi:hypothetical protein CCM_03767 [Cordyceps militaris CM01]|uniref:Uncharacterized protein n=1 Tax=Cordyceps militaris (strain CM01) TaxID=983644 RepID=G3JGH7_CORMM|nr:uncharacterized protein CCM_03767 [Cordyceps militaris CM01]EGX92394.1 hypothetical protein CCM_03767 [Cordyceps militaris CM01]
MLEMRCCGRWCGSSPGSCGRGARKPFVLTVSRARRNLPHCSSDSAKAHHGGCSCGLRLSGGDAIFDGQSPVCPHGVISVTRIIRTKMKDGRGYAHRLSMVIITLLQEMSPGGTGGTGTLMTAKTIEALVDT